MNVGDQLGLDGGSELLEQARQRWATWVASDDRLGVVDDFDDLRDWLATADRDGADDVLPALAMLAAPDGGDDVAAAGAPAKCLLPGACRLAAWLATQRRHMLPGDVQLATELVASQLWIEVRTFPWRRGKKVAANILMNTRAGVLRECGDFTQVARTDQTRVHTELVEAFASCDQGADIDVESCRMGALHQPAAGWRPCLLADPNPGPGEDHSALEELLEVLAWACDQDVINAEDRYLLLCLVEETIDRSPATRDPQALLDYSTGPVARLATSPRGLPGPPPSWSSCCASAAATPTSTSRTSAGSPTPGARSTPDGSGGLRSARSERRRQPPPPVSAARRRRTPPTPLRPIRCRLPSLSSRLGSLLPERLTARRP